ncbi:exported hypothetical protein [uncultured Alphaproteobacteria bacterium]|uniref:Uncharacterized protein n=1 Tax=uncultured Alphaproteobacteria bacterium TaxID=91750 RepID=A0A212J431_9PROT|nr:exported hypothetical protein [uncultured Alphaproteobacteria bacterium]
MLAVIAGIWRNRYLLLALACAALLASKESTIAELRAKIAADALAAAHAANAASRQSFTDLVLQSNLAFAAIEAADTAAAERAATVAKLKETARNAPIPPDACRTVGPRLGAVLDGLRHRQTGTADRDAGGEGEAATPAADVRP